MREINKIIIHCSATRPDYNIGVKEIRHWHMNGRKNWSDIGYHFVIRLGGHLETGRPVARIGAHVKGHNRDSLGVCLIGGHGSSAEDDFFDHFSDFQYHCLKDSLGLLKAVYPQATIHGHNEFAAKACPGFNVQEFLNGYLPELINA